MSIRFEGVATYRCELEHMESMADRDRKSRETIVSDLLGNNVRWVTMNHDPP